MNISNQIQILSVPFWARAIVFILVSSSTGICIFLFYTALTTGTRPDWIAAGTYLLGIVFPILLLTILVSSGSFGETSIIRRTEIVLTKTIPYHLQFIPEEDQRFRPYQYNHRSPLTPQEALAKIDLHHTKGRCYADYLIRAPLNGELREIHLRIELNIKRVNVNFIFPKEHIQILAQQNNCDNSDDLIRMCFEHSFFIEKIQSRETPPPGAHENVGTISYAFNEALLTRTVGGTDYICIVASTGVAPDLVWNPSERVFFAQDLMFMVRAFLQECPSAFPLRRENA